MKRSFAGGLVALLVGFGCMAYSAGDARAEEPDADAAATDDMTPADEPLPDEAGLGAPDPTPAPPDSTSKYDITVREKRPTTAASSQTVRTRDFELQPMESPAEILHVVPGLFTAQHAGGGKADQIFLRGFDADHGTDVSIHVDGLPVNLRSHAHGQGYADLHFLIPETIDRVEVFKGPYFADFGDFATAGAVNLVPKEKFEESFARFEGGSFDTRRYLAVYSPNTGPFEGEDAPLNGWLAGEYQWTNGPFDFPQRMGRKLAAGLLGADLGESHHATAWFQLYLADWNASGQIPLRAVDDGMIDRFGAIDPTEGGHTYRANFLLRDVWTLGEEEHVQVTAWASRYQLKLFSNFTFFLNNPDNGQTDGIVQNDDRWLYGGEILYRKLFDWEPLPVAFTAGLQTRTDSAEVQLGTQTYRHFTGYTRQSDVRQTSIAPYLQAEVFLAPWARSLLGLRGENFWYNVKNFLDEPGQPDGSKIDGLVLPKANLILKPFAEEGPLAVDFDFLKNGELYLNYGWGFHSNDARDVTCNADDLPDTECDPDAVTLPLAVGWEVGWRTTLYDRVDIAVSQWWLNLQEELVFVGDEGTEEVRGRSRRHGIEGEVRVRIFDWLTYKADVTLSHAVFSDGGVVDQAPRMTAATSLVARHSSGLSGELRMRSLGRRYALEDDPNILLHGYAVFDLGVRYRWRFLEVAAAIENITNEQWPSAEFYFASRLQGEPPEGIEDFNFTPGNPRSFRVGLTAFF
jgi:outer membrane receptor protein involved in Fe transport